MSGIAGIIGSSASVKKVNTSSIKKALIEKRPSDSIKTLSSPNFWLLYSKFITTRESINEIQPYYCTKASLTILADARIDNRDEMIDLLECSGEINDSQIILEAYKKYNKKCLDYIIGAFVFVIYNSESRSIFAARDHIGHRQFYYAYNKDLFTFSNEIKPILESKQFEKKPDKEKIIRFIALGSDTSNATFYDGIKKLNKACYLTVENKILKTHQYYRLSDVSFVRSENYNYEKHFLELFKKVISSMQRSHNEKIGTTLSGGLDSSSITSILIDQKIENLYAYSAIFTSLDDHDFKKTDEKSYMLDMVDNKRLKHRFVKIDNQGPIEYLLYNLNNFERPMSVINSYMHMMILKACKDDGSRVLFDGFDGDSVVSHGVERLYELGMSLNLFSLFEENIKVAKKFDLKFSYIKSFIRFSLKPILNKLGVLNFIYKLLRKDVYDGSRLNKLNFKYLKDNHINKYKDKATQQKSSEKMHKTAMDSSIWEDSLEFIDRMGAMNSIDFRLPFMDKRIIEFCSSVPAELKLKDGITRYYFRSALKDILPTSIKDRLTKADLSPQAINDIEKNINKIKKILFDNQSCTSNVLNIKNIQGDINYFIDNQNSDRTEIVVQIYSLLALELWMKREKFKL